MSKPSVASRPIKEVMSEEQRNIDYAKMKEQVQKIEEMRVLTETLLKDKKDLGNEIVDLK